MADAAPAVDAAPTATSYEDLAVLADNGTLEDLPNAPAEVDPIDAAVDAAVAAEEAQPPESTDEPKPDEQVAPAEEAPAVDKKSLDPKLKVKVKVDGKDEEVTLGEVIKRYEHQQAGFKRMQEATQKIKAADTFARMLLDTNQLPLIIDKLHGEGATRALAESYLGEQLKFELLPEAEQRALRAESELRTKRMNEERLQEQQAVQQFTQDTQVAATKLVGDIRGALSAAKLPESKFAIQMTAHYIKQARAEGYTDFGVKDAVELVKEDMIKAAEQLHGRAPADGELADKVIAGGRPTLQRNPQGKAPAGVKPSSQVIERAGKKEPTDFWKDFNNKWGM